MITNMKGHIEGVFAGVTAFTAGATMVSPFIGRLDDRGARGMELIEDIVQTFVNYPTLNTHVLVASIRNADHVRRSREG